MTDSAREVDDEALLERYLLGEASPDDQTSLEDRYLQDDSLVERIRGVEAELIDAYWGGRLSSGNRRAFETHYLAEPAHRDRALFAKALIDYAASAGARSAAPSRAVTAPSRVRLGGWPMIAGWAATIAVVAGLTIETWQLRGELTAVRNQLAALHAQGSAATGSADPQRGQPPINPDRSPVAWIRLRPGRVRDGSSRTTTSIRASPDPPRVQLDVPVAGPGPYRLIAETAEGREAWRTERVDAERAIDGWAVFVVLDRVLAPGDYVFTLRTIDPAGRDVAEYFLRVDRR
jgi:hypothetical protein